MTTSNEKHIVDTLAGLRAQLSPRAVAVGIALLTTLLLVGVSVFPFEVK